MIKLNLTKAGEIADFFDSSFKFRWDIYNDYMKANLNQNSCWLDLGCGDNSDIALFGEHCSFTVGLDINSIIFSSSQTAVCGDINRLPFKTNSFDFITLRFVAEHLDNITDVFNEINRVLKPEGKILIMTTNLLSPFVFLPKLIPVSLKKYLLRRIFKVAEDDIFPTYHKLNSKSKFYNLPGNLKVNVFEYVQDTNISNLMIFLILLFWHLLTKIPFFKFLRTNIIVILSKS